MTLELHATGNGLAPSLDKLVELDIPGFEIAKTDDQGLSIARVDSGAASVNAVSERTWLLTLKPAGDAGGTLSFKFPQPTGLVAKSVFKQYSDADLVEVDSELALAGIALLPEGGNIVIPQDAGVVHFEAEMVIVISKKARNVSKAKALDFVLGVTCGNDISAREWQKNDVQWWRAKGSDTFGPCGPCIASGLDYDNLQMKLRLNGKVMQDENTSYLINDVRTTVSFISRHVTLNPGDLIFPGTPGTTSGIEPGDTVEVEIEGVGVLRNNVVAGK